MNVHIRTATENDLLDICTIYNHAILYTTAVYTYDPETFEERREWFKQKQSSNLPIFVAEIDSSVTGFASYGPFRPWPAFKHTIEHSIYVHPDFRKMGVAARLLTELIETARQLKIHTMIAGIDSSNQASIHLHTKFGFEQVALLKQVGYKFEQWLDLLFMQLILIA